MKRLLTALMLSEYDRLKWGKILRNLYYDKGDWEIYSLPPCVILDEADHFIEETYIGNGIYRLGGDTVRVSSFTVLPVKGSLPAYSKKAGLFITSDASRSYSFPEDAIKVSDLALISFDDERHSFRILRTRPLKKDR